MAHDMNVPFLGSLPLDPRVVEASDDGVPFIDRHSDSEVALSFSAMVENLIDHLEKTDPVEKQGKVRRVSLMKIAIPMVQGKLSTHFGHCEEFALIEVEPQKKEILSTETLGAPPHEPGLLPRWLSEKGTNLIIAGGMGSRAKNLFAEKGIEVVVGAPSEEPVVIAQAYLDGKLAQGENICDH